MLKNIAVFVLVVVLNLKGVMGQEEDQQSWKHVGSFHRAVACSIDPAGNVYVLDAASSELVKFSFAGEELGRVGSFGWGELAFDRPADVIAPNGLDVYVADYGNHRIQRFDRNFNFVSTLASKIDGNIENHFAYPKSVVISALGSLFFVDGDNKRIVKLDGPSKIERMFGGIEDGLGRLSSPSKIRMSESNTVYVQDGDKLVSFDQFGNYLRTVRSDTLRTLRSFTVDRKDLYLLSNAKVDVINENDFSERRTLLLTTTYESDSSKLVDLGVLGDKIILLTEHDYVIVVKDSLIELTK